MSRNTAVRSGPGAGRSVPRDPGSPAGGIGSAGSPSPGPDLTAAATNVRGASAGALPSAEPSRQGRPADHLKWAVVVGPLPPRCDARPSKRSTARCEMPPDHDGGHIGRTRGGYWKCWPGQEQS